MWLSFAAAGVCRASLCPCVAGVNQVQQAFRMFDEDSSGTVSAAEFRLALAALGFDMTDAEFDKLMNKCVQCASSTSLVPPPPAGMSFPWQLHHARSHVHGCVSAVSAVSAVLCCDVLCSALLCSRCEPRRYDVDGSGTVSYMEFNANVEKLWNKVGTHERTHNSEFRKRITDARDAQRAEEQEQSAAGRDGWRWSGLARDG